MCARFGRIGAFCENRSGRYLSPCVLLWHNTTRNRRREVSYVTDTTAQEPNNLDAAEARIKALEEAEDAIESAYATGRANRAEITRSAQDAAARAVDIVGTAMEADELADDAMRIAVIAEQTGGYENAKEARKREREARKNARVQHKAATQAAKEAYDAIKYSDPNTMGFMRVVQVLFAIHIVSYIILLGITSRDIMIYDITTVRSWIMVILEGVAFWLFVNRYKVARPFVIGMSIIAMAIPLVWDLATGTFNLFAWLFNDIFYVFLLLYFTFSDRVKVVLVNDISQNRDTVKQDFVIERRGWPFVRNLIMYFVVFSLLGHWMEMAMCQLIIAGLVQGDYDPTNTMLWRDWLFPFPMEGAAVVFIALFLHPFFIWLKKKMSNRWLPYVISFVSNALLCTAIEFSMGLVFNAHYEFWNYSDHFCNIMGQVCLQNTLAFGVAASLISWFVYPLLERWIARVPRDIMNIAFVVVLIFGGIIFSLYMIDLPQFKPSPEELAAPESTPAEKDAHALAVSLYNIDSNIGELESKLAESKNLDPETVKALEAEIEALRAQEQEILTTLGLESMPTAEELITWAME